MERVSMIGIDTAKNVFQVCGLDDSGSVVMNIRLKRRQVLAFFEKQPACTVAFEACGASYYWARQITQRGHLVKLVPPPFLKRFMNRHKNDARDAHALALAGGDPLLRPVPVKSETEQADLMLFKVRSLLVRQYTQASNSLRGQLAEFGLTANTGTKGLEGLVEKIEAGSVMLPDMAVAALAVLIRHWRNLSVEIAGLTASLIQQVKGNERIARLMTVPGVGPIIACVCAAKLGDASRFACARDFAAWLGLTPKQNSTAHRRRLGSITKAGDEDLRSLLVLGAATALIRAKRKPDSADPWAKAILKRRPFKVAAVALAARNARTLWAILRDGSVYEPRRSRTLTSNHA
jgi:transposase